MNNEALKQILKKKYEGKFRRDSVTPAFTHIERVADRVLNMEHWSDKDSIQSRTLVQIALLHDVVEDGIFKINELRTLKIKDQYLLLKVLPTVEILTKDKYDDYLEYIEQIRHNGWAKKVKIADILDNLSDAPTEKQIIKYAKALLVLYGSSYENIHLND